MPARISSGCARSSPPSPRRHPPHRPMTTHAERRPVPYSPEQMYALVADVERYPEFLPWCLAAKIRQREGAVIYADLVIGFRMIRERFTSRVALQPGHRIDVNYSEGPFRYLENHWIFEPTAGGGCVIDFHVDFEFKNRVLQKIITVLFNEAVRRMVAAFE